MSQQSFRGLGVSAPVADALAARSILEPFQIQSLVLPDALAGLDVLAKSPTGSGKTLAFAVPIVERTTTEDARPSAHVVVATPGRLEDLAQRRLIDLSRIRILVLDEADRMLDMGFKPQVDRIVRRVPRNRQTMFFSATLDGEVGELARAYTSGASRFSADAQADQAEGVIEHRFVPVSTDSKVETLVEHLRAAPGRTLVFVRTKRGADRLVKRVAPPDVKAEALHGDMAPRARQRALERFESGRMPVLVATDVAARGLDIDDIEHVINFDPPDEDKGYLHRTGRTGRAGKSGIAVTFVLPEQQAEASRVASRLGHREQFEEAGMQTARSKLVYTSRRGRRSKW